MIIKDKITQLLIINYLCSEIGDSVDQVVDLAKVLGNLGYDFEAVVPLGQIRSISLDLRSRTDFRIEVTGDQLVGLGLVEVDDGHGRAVVQEPCHDGGPDPAAASSHDSNLKQP